MYRQSTTTDPMKTAECPECQSKRLLLKGSTLQCTNCGITIGKLSNKYGAKRTEFKGKIFDSKFEAGIAEELETRKIAKDIKDYETQYRVDMQIHRPDGLLAFVVKHKVDFRIHHNDGSFELYEAKGVETADYKFRRRCLENVWLPLHKDHIYTVIKQNGRR